LRRFDWSLGNQGLTLESLLPKRKALPEKTASAPEPEPAPAVAEPAPYLVPPPLPEPDKPTFTTTDFDGLSHLRGRN